LGRVNPETAPGYTLTLQMRPCDVHFFITVMEGYSHLAFPAAVDPKAGLIVLHTTPGFFADLKKIVGELALETRILDDDVYLSKDLL